MEPHPEHHQHDAELGQLTGEMDVGHEAGRGRARYDAGDEVPDQRWHAEPGGQVPHDEGEPKAGGDRRDEGDVVVHDGAAGYGL
jgi:hypothetical protein